MMLACKEGNCEVVSAIMKETLDSTPEGIKRVLSMEVCTSLGPKVRTYVLYK